MAVPVMLGIGPLMAFLLSILEWLVVKLAAHFTMRMATSLAWIAFYIGLLVALAATFSAILGGISAALPGDLASAMGAVKPVNFEACMSAIYTSKIAMWVFQQKRQLVDWERKTGGYGRAGRVIS